jgi:hypothetical protein
MTFHLRRSDIHSFRPFLLRHLWTLHQNFPSRITFPFLQYLHGDGHRARPIGHPREFEHTVQETVVWKTSNASFLLNPR